MGAGNANRGRDTPRRPNGRPNGRDDRARPAAELTVNGTTREVEVPLEVVTADGAPVVLSVSDTTMVEIPVLMSRE